MKVLTANRLADGIAVWFAGDRWAETVQGAQVAADAQAEARMEQAGKAAYLNNEVVDVNLIDVTVEAGAVVPVRMREQIRAAGPTVRTDLGIQARPLIDS